MTRHLAAVDRDLDVDVDDPDPLDDVLTVPRSAWAAAIDIARCCRPDAADGALVPTTGYEPCPRCGVRIVRVAEAPSELGRASELAAVFVLVDPPSGDVAIAPLVFDHQCRGRTA